MLKKLFSSESGFTLVELLVIIAIMAVLFGIVTLSLSGLNETAVTGAKVAECQVVKSAMNIWMAVDPSHTIKKDRKKGIIKPNKKDAPFADAYIRDLPTSYEYSWNTAGEVTCEDLD